MNIYRYKLFSNSYIIFHYIKINNYFYSNTDYSNNTTIGIIIANIHIVNYISSFTNSSISCNSFDYIDFDYCIECYDYMEYIFKSFFSFILGL